MVNQVAIQIGAWSMSGTPWAALQLASTGADWITLDAQHGFWDQASMTAALELLAHARPDCEPWVRVAANDPSQIGRALDSGATGVIVPMVNSTAEAAAAAAACRYPPLGARSWGPAAAYRGEPVESPEQVNTAVRCAVMIETPQAVERADEIAATPGVDMLFVGPFDLALSYGIDRAGMLADRSSTAPLVRVIEATRRAGIEAGAFAGSLDAAALLRDHGFEWLSVAVDTALIADAGRAMVTEARTLL